MIIQNRNYTATVTHESACYTVKIFVNGVTPKQIDERNWVTKSQAERDAGAMMKLYK